MECISSGGNRELYRRELGPEKDLQTAVCLKENQLFVAGPSCNNVVFTHILKYQTTWTVIGLVVVC